jgi:hypothetical protein
VGGGREKWGEKREDRRREGEESREWKEENGYLFNSREVQVC